MSNPYSPGDRLRVTVEDAYNTGLRIGDIVTVDEVATKKDSNDAEIPVVYVLSEKGTRVLGLDAVEPFVADYVPAEPDEVIDAQFAALIESDADLGNLASLGDTALGAEGREVSPALGGGDSVTKGPWSDPTEGDLFKVIDSYGDELLIVYAERATSKGREAALFFNVEDGETVILPMTHIDTLIRWMFGKRQQSRRPDDTV